MTPDPNPDHTGRMGPHTAAWLLALANLVVTAGVLLSPWGSGQGSGVIGYSVVRLLILVVVQAPIALSGLVAAAVSAKEGLEWGSPLLVHAIIAGGAVYLYFT